MLIVEGDAEVIILPALAKLIGKDLTAHGVSIVNVGGRGLRRFSRIFQRKDFTEPAIGVPVACIADMDVMPDCAPGILGLVDGDGDPKWQSTRRRWKATRDFGSDDKEREDALAELRKRFKENDGQFVQTFVADHWTLEYDLARCGLAEQVHIAASLAKNDDPLNEERKKRDDVISEAKSEFATLKSESVDDEKLCSRVYRAFHSGAASKAVAAQHLAEILSEEFDEGGVDATGLRASLPSNLIQAIDYVTAPPRQQITKPGDTETGGVNDA